MKRLSANAIWGIILIGLGVLYLLQNFGYLKGPLNMIWPVLFAAAGIGFLAVYMVNRANWWALIPGFTLLGLAVLVVLGLTSDRLAEVWGGPVFLGAIGLSFWAVYAARRENWWAIIPGGTLVTLAVVAGVDAGPSRLNTGAVFFIGLAITFALVYVLGRMSWTLYPAAALALMGIFIGVGLENLTNYIWPIALIGGGALLVWRALRRNA